MSVCTPHAPRRTRGVRAAASSKRFASWLTLVAVLVCAPASAQQRLQSTGEVELSLASVRVVAGDSGVQRVAVSDGMHAIAMVSADAVTWKRHEHEWVTDMAFAQSDKLLVATGGGRAGGGTSSVVIRDAADGHRLGTVADFGGRVAAGADTLVVAGGQGAARLVRHGDTWKAEPFYTLPVEAVAVSVDGRHIALADMQVGDGAQRGSTPNNIRLFRVHDASVEADTILRGHAMEVAALAFIGSGDLVSADFDGQVRLWPQLQAPGRGISREFCRHGASRGEPCGLVASHADDWLTGPFGDTVMLGLPDGTMIDTTAVIMQQGPSITTFADHAKLAWVGRPPTFPTSVVRWWRIDTQQVNHVQGNGQAPDALTTKPAIGAEQMDTGRGPQ